MAEITLKVDGMHCPSCEKLVAEDVGEITNVQKVEVDHKKGAVKITYEGKLDLEKVKKAITELDYTVVSDGE